MKISDEFPTEEKISLGIALSIPDIEPIKPNFSTSDLKIKTEMMDEIKEEEKDKVKEEIMDETEIKMEITDDEL